LAAGLIGVCPFFDPARRLGFVHESRRGHFLSEPATMREARKRTNNFRIGDKPLGIRHSEPRTGLGVALFALAQNDSD